MITKKSLLFIVIFICTANFAFTQNYNWITPNKTYLKMYLSEDGMYRIKKSDFNNAGINTTGLDPRTVKVLYKGSQLPIYFNGEQDGIFNDNDYFDFYGLKNRGGFTNTYNENNAVVYTTNEYFNLYSDTSVYWVDWNGANGLRYSTNNFSSTVSYPNNYFYDTLHFEKDKIYSQGEHVSDSDYRYLTDQKFRGETWYWALLNNNQSLTDTFSVRELSNSSPVSSIRVFAYPLNRETQNFNEHVLELKINGNIVKTFLSNDFQKIDTTITFPTSLLSGSSVNNVTLTYSTPVSGFGGAMYIDLFEISYPKFFKIRNNNLQLSLSQADTTSRQFKVSGYNPLNAINVYDVRNNLRITNLAFASDTVKFTAKSNSKLEIINDSIRMKPFRIKQRQVSPLATASNGVDYLVIYPSILESQAEQLRAYRQAHDGFRSVKVEIEEIYDIFNYGNEDPVGVKNFTKYVHDNWQLPKIKYICLFGRGSLDPKRNSTSSAYSNNYIPVFGNPNTDGYFANTNVGTFFYYDQIAIGRLPAYYPAEAQAMVNKIIAYENEKADRWWKGFTFITGGALRSEQLFYQQTSNFENNVYVTPNPIAGESFKVYRNDSLGAVSYNYADSIKNTINRGTLYVNFRGHAGSHDWEVGLHDPNTLSNGNKLPIVLSLTCYTGESAKGDFRGFGEKFMYLENKGAIGFVGTTGWSFASQGNEFGIYIIQAIKSDTLRRMGDLTKSAGKQMSGDSLLFNIRHTVNCYNLLGDPAVTLKLPEIPEFEIKESDYKFSEESVQVNDPVNLKIYPKNYGLYADSCKIRFQLKRYNQNYLVRDTVYKSFRFLDSLAYNFNIDSPGVYTMTVNLDQDNWYPLEDKTNNTITFPVNLKQNSFTPIEPIDNSVVFKDTVEFSSLNPFVKFVDKSVKVILQLDSSNKFNSPVTQTFVNGSVTGTVTKFKTRLPVLNNNTLFYWRTNSILNGDSSGWSKVQRFIYNNGAAIRDDGGKDRYINSVTPVVLSKAKPTQYSEADYNNTYYSNEGIKLSQYTSTLFVRSYGSNGDEASYFSVGNRNVFIDGFGANAGLNMIKVKKLNGNILTFKNLKMNSATSSDSLLAFLNTFDSTQYLMLLNAAYFPVNGTVLSVSARAKLNQFGSIYCDSIGILSYFHTWSFIGWLGADSSQAEEMFDPCCRIAPGCVSCDHWTQSVSSMNVNFINTTGTVSNIIGPAEEWNDFSWNETSGLNMDVGFDVIGISNSGQQTLLMSNVQADKFADLTSINARQYPKLNLLAKLNIDTTVGTISPVLSGLKVNYFPASELILDKNSLQISSSDKNEKIINYTFNYHNAGYNFINGIIINTYSNSISDPNLLTSDTTTNILKIDSTMSYSHSLDIPASRDTSSVYIYIKPRFLNQEFYTFNNLIEVRVGPVLSGLNAKVEVFSDGRQISSGDNVSKKPEFKINIASSDIMNLLTDTSKISLLL
ncbi:MAG: C25 family cysteine peptidase, partial [bacterium]